MTKKPKFALIAPNLRWSDWDANTAWRPIPYNLCILGAMIEDICNVILIDANIDDLTEDQLLEKLNEFNPDYAAISVMMDQYAESGHKAAQVSKKVTSHPIVIIGGVYPTMNSLDVIRDQNIDYVIVGEGEYVLRDLVLHHSYGKTLPEKGIVYRDGKTVLNRGHSDFITDLDAIPLPAYHLIDYLKYATKYERKSVDGPRSFPFGQIVSSRGCPYGCVFCQVESIMGKKFRSRSAKNVLQEIEFLKKTYGIRSLIFYDDNLLTDRKRAFQVFSGMIERGLAMPWTMGGTAVFKLDEELIKLMRQSGCDYLDIAIESGTERIRKLIGGKPVNVEHAKKMIRIIKENDIFIAANFIVGFPTETWDEIRETIAFAESLELDYLKLFIVIPLKKTKLWDLCIATSSFKKNFDETNIRWGTGQTESSTFTANDLTVLRAFEWDRINFTDSKKRKKIADAMGISLDELLEIRRRTINDVFLNITK